MSYQAISIKEAMNKINAATNGWFLPQIQRPYVWGGRHESESYVCSLFDSILKGYPIGGLVIWETEARVPHREFLTNYDPLSKQRMVQEGRWGCAKGLVYDGQQRLQTLYSALRYTFNGRVLIFDLCFDANKEGQEPSETGFEFINQSSELPKGAVCLSQLFCQPEKGESKIALRKEIFSKNEFTEDEKNRIEINLDKLWSTFVEANKKPISYFPVQSATDLEVNEIFQRLNSGGMPLTQIDLLFSRITQNSPSFKDKLSDASDDIKAIAGNTGSGNGIEFSPEEILQVIHLALVGSPTVRSERVREPSEFVQYWDDLEEPLKAFFNEYLWGRFKVNSNSIIPRNLALLPIIIFLTKFYKSGRKFRAIKEDELLLLDQYFILSQLNDWNTATMVGAFASKVINAVDGHFPLDEIKLIAEKRRRTDLRMMDILNERLFVLKILTPNRAYNFSGSKPEVDHIFPRRLSNPPDGYSEDEVDVLWNLQPVPFAVNNSKRAKHPLDFFKSDEGTKYFSEYDYLPEVDNKLWNAPFDFIEERKSKMIKALQIKYQLTIVETEPANQKH